MNSSNPPSASSNSSANSNFLRSSWLFIGFGFLTAFFSSFGQTFFIGLFGGELREEFNLSHGDWGQLYSLATLASAIALTWTGRLIDRMPLVRYTSLVGFVMVGACLGMTDVNGLLKLGFLIFLIRHTGQGLFGHIAMTSMGRYFERNRGKAISLAVLGLPLGQAFLPRVAAGLIETRGWRETWYMFGIAIAIVAPILIAGTLRGYKERHKRWLEKQELAEDTPLTPADDSAESHPGTQVSWTRGQVLRDPRFWLIMPATLAPAILLTGIFFHQAHWVEVKGWSLAAWTGAFVFFSALQVLGSLVAGPLVDRRSAIWLLNIFLLPLILGLVLLAEIESGFGATLFLSLAGLTGGLSMTMSGALWAELYGVVHLGAVRSVFSALAVFSTSLAPVGMGRLIDAGMHVDQLARLGAVYCGLSLLLAFAGLRFARNSGQDSIS